MDTLDTLTTLPILPFIKYIYFLCTADTGQGCQGCQGCHAFTAISCFTGFFIGAEEEKHRKLQFFNFLIFLAKYQSVKQFRLLSKGRLKLNS